MCPKVWPIDQLKHRFLNWRKISNRFSTSGPDRRDKKKIYKSPTQRNIVSWNPSAELSILLLRLVGISHSSAFSQLRLPLSYIFVAVVVVVFFCLFLVPSSSYVYTHREFLRLNGFISLYRNSTVANDIVYRPCFGNGHWCTYVFLYLDTKLNEHSPSHRQKSISIGYQIVWPEYNPSNMRH